MKFKLKISLIALIAFATSPVAFADRECQARLENISFFSALPAPKQERVLQINSEISALYQQIGGALAAVPLTRREIEPIYIGGGAQKSPPPRPGALPSLYDTMANLVSERRDLLSMGSHLAHHEESWLATWSRKSIPNTMPIQGKAVAIYGKSDGEYETLDLYNAPVFNTPNTVGPRSTERIFDNKFIFKLTTYGDKLRVQDGDYKIDSPDQVSYEKLNRVLPPPMLLDGTDIENLYVVVILSTGEENLNRAPVIYFIAGREGFRDMRVTEHGIIISGHLIPFTSIQQMRTFEWLQASSGGIGA